MGTSAEPFTEAIYARLREGTQSSAAAVVPLVLRHLTPRPETVVDVGCGEGWWGKAFADEGCEVFGLDTEEADPVITRHVCDLAEPGVLTAGRYDLAVCLEVAEHLPPERADSFIDDLCRVAPVILFSAAIPGQGGTGHLNEQWPGYWVERFERNGYECSGAIRWHIWNDDRVENWYRQNLMVAARSWTSAVNLFSESAGTREMLPVVHPVLFDARRETD